MQHKTRVNSKNKENKEEKTKDRKKWRVMEVITSFSEQAEIKKLGVDDSEECESILSRMGIEFNRNILRSVLSAGISFGAYVSRALIGVSLAVPASFNERTLEVSPQGEIPNAIYMETPVVLLPYEGGGLRRKFVREIEKEAKKKGYSYVVAYIEEFLPEGTLKDYLAETNKKIGKTKILKDYRFINTDKGTLAVKKVGL